MKTIKYIFFLIIFFITACKAFKTYSDCDTEINFSHYKTFAWLPDIDTSKNIYPNKIILNNTRNYFSYCMAERGYKGNPEDPDFFLDLVITKSKKQKAASSIMCYQSSCNYFYLNPYFYPSPNPYYFNKPLPYNYEEDYTYVSHREEYTQGALTLNIIDRKRNRLVWTGTVWGDLFDTHYSKNNLHPMVYSLLEKFPVQPIRKELSRKK